MKRWILSLLCILLLIGSASAAEQYVYDLAGLMSAAEIADLEQRAARISEAYRCDVYIVTTSDTGINEYNVRSTAEAFYQTNGLGYGLNRDGELLLLSMAERDYALIAYGDFGNYTFTDYGKSRMEASFLDEFGLDDWYGGFCDYLRESETTLQLAANGTPMEEDTDPDLQVSPVTMFVCFLFAGLVIAGIVAGITAAMLKKRVRAATDADGYLANVDITSRSDVFTHMTTVRVPIETEQSRSHSGGTRVSSSGFSGHSGKF